jgi:hypothetical protein
VAGVGDELVAAAVAVGAPDLRAVHGNRERELDGTDLAGGGLERPQPLDGLLGVHGHRQRQLDELIDQLIDLADQVLGSGAHRRVHAPEPIQGV